MDFGGNYMLSEALMHFALGRGYLFLLIMNYYTEYIYLLKLELKTHQLTNLQLINIFSWFFLFQVDV